MAFIDRTISPGCPACDDDGFRCDICGCTGPVHPDRSDDEAVDLFAAAMKEKLAAKRAEGRGGWNDPAKCSIEFLVSLLHGHVQKGDPVDIGNIAMMLWNRGVRGNSK